MIIAKLEFEKGTKNYITKRGQHTRARNGSNNKQLTNTNRITVEEPTAAAAIEVGVRLFVFAWWGGVGL